MVAWNGQQESVLSCSVEPLREILDYRASDQGLKRQQGSSSEDLWTAEAGGEWAEPIPRRRAAHGRSHIPYQMQKDTNVKSHWIHCCSSQSKYAATFRVLYSSTVQICLSFQCLEGDILILWGSGQGRPCNSGYCGLKYPTDSSDSVCWSQIGWATPSERDGCKGTSFRCTSLLLKLGQYGLPFGLVCSRCSRGICRRSWACWGRSSNKTGQVRSGPTHSRSWRLIAPQNHPRAGLGGLLWCPSSAETHQQESHGSTRFVISGKTEILSMDYQISRPLRGQRGPSHLDQKEKWTGAHIIAWEFIIYAWFPYGFGLFQTTTSWSRCWTVEPSDVPSTSRSDAEELRPGLGP